MNAMASSPMWIRSWPTLKPSDVIVLDNLNAHEVPRIREAIEAADAKLPYLPPYSPGLRVACCKTQSAATKAAERSVENLWNCIACFLDAFQPDECANYFRNSGYAAC